MTDRPLDKFNKPISVGDYIVYGHLLSRSAALKVGRVIGVTQKEKRGPYDSGWAIRVVGVEDSWSHVEPRLGKPGTILFPNRCLVVHSGHVPEKFFDLLYEMGVSDD